MSAGWQAARGAARERVAPALESITSKWLHAHVPAAAGASCPAFQSTATERIWPQPWQKGGIFLLVAVARVSMAHRHAHTPAVSNLHLGASFAGLSSVAAKWPQRRRAKLSHPEEGLRVSEVKG